MIQPRNVSIAAESRPSRELAERLAQVLEVPEADVPAFLRLARGLRPDAAPPLPVLAPALTPHEVGAEDLSGREARGYALRERLGIGGFGAVYRAVQSSIGRDLTDDERAQYDIPNDGPTCSPP